LLEGREKLGKRSVAVICLFVVTAVALLWYGIAIGVHIGAEWFTYKAADEWHMTNYFIIDAKYAYTIFGLAALAVGGLFTGLAFSAFRVHHKTRKQTILQGLSFFAAIALSGLGFNTLNYMLGSFYWTNMQYPPPVSVPVFGSVDVWNFYFFFFLVPLWAGGLLIGLAAMHYAFIYRPYRAAHAYVLKKNLAPIIQAKKEYLAESAVMIRKRSQTKLPIENPVN
jgi:hypothetical protein